MRFTDDGTQLITVEGIREGPVDPNSLRRYEIASAKELERFPVDGWVALAAYSPDGTLAACYFGNGALQIRRTIDGTLTARFGEVRSVRALAYAPTSDFVALSLAAC
jgi:hypothetical protein